MAILAPTLRQRFFTSAGLPLAGGKLYTYAAGTTTPLSSYTDATETVANANPVILDANGECNLWLGSNAYKILLTDSSDVTQWTTDNVNQASENTRSSPNLLENFGITCTTNSNILTINLTNASGGTPSALSPVAVGFRSSTLASGLTSVLSINSALGMTVSSGSTLGHLSAVEDYIYVYLINYNGTAELAVSTTLYTESALYSTTAEGGAGAADSRSVIYSITARTNVPIRAIGRLTVTQATAGAWASIPTQIQAGAIDQIYAQSLGLITQGTWTPAAAFGGAAVGMTFSNQVGYYVKTGRAVTCYGTLTFTARGSSTGTMTITGLPFTADSNASYGFGGSVIFNSVSDSTNIMSGYINSSTTTATIIRTASGVSSSTVVGPGDFADNSIFTFTIIYLSAT